MTRRDERRHAFCLVFALGFDTGLLPKATEADTPSDLIEIELDPETTVWVDPQEQALQWYLEGAALDAPKKSASFILNSLTGVINHLETLDGHIKAHLKKWTFERLNAVDVAILRLAIYEVLFTDTPNQVVANEAVELAKAFSSDDGPAFVNGVLAGVIKTAPAP